MNKQDLGCDATAGGLFEFIDRELCDDARDAVRRHLASCSACASRARFESRLKDRLRELGSGEPAKQTSERIALLLRCL